MIKIKIETSYVPLTQIIKQDVPSGVSVNIPPFKEQRGMDAETTIMIILTVTNMAIPFIVEWLRFKKITERATKITIDEKEVELEYGDIKRIIDRKITTEQ